MALRRLASAITLSAGTKTNSASLSTNFLISHGQATRSTLTRSLVIHFMSCLLGFAMYFSHSISTGASEDQRRARRQQQHEHDPTKHRFVEMAVELHAQPGGDEQHRKSKQEQPDCVCRDDTLGAEPRGAHGKDRNRYGLKDGALLILRPAAQPAPDCHEN